MEWGAIAFSVSLCLFNFYVEYIMKNAGLGEAQAGIKIAGRNINNLRYVDDTTLMSLHGKIDGETVESVRLYFGGLQNHCKW